MSKGGNSVDQEGIFSASMISAHDELARNMQARGAVRHMHDIWGSRVQVLAETADVPVGARSITDDMLVQVRVDSGPREGYKFKAPAWMLNLTQRQIARLQAYALLKLNGARQ